MCRSSLRFPLTIAVLLALTLSGCSEQSGESPTAPQLQSAAGIPSGPPGFEAALLAQERHTPRLMATPGVVGTAVGLNPAGRAVVKVFTEKPDIGGVPATLDQVPVAVEVTGLIYARSDPTTRRRPAPVGFSVGHPAITAGTIGGRVIDLLGNVYLLSNNHVLANANGAPLNDPALQPGPLDGGTDPADRIGTLFAFEPLNLGWNQYGVDPPSNWMDAAMALSSNTLVSNSTPTDDGYGVPSSSLYADGNGDGFFDDRGLLLGIGVQKYGRTTRLTQGQITGVNVTIDVCYDIFCLTVGRFHDQVAICCSGFSDGGDSGSLIVSSDGNKNPVALLFAGDGSLTYANRIDLVLDRFGVTMDGSALPPPPPAVGTMQVGNLDGRATVQSRTWTAIVTVLIEDPARVPVSTATVTGTFSAGAKGTGTCTTGSNGTCTITKSRLRSGSVTFRVTNVTHATRTYQSAGNHDPGGDSDGTTVIVFRP